MAEIIELAPHDPLPASANRYVLVLARFDDDDPHQVVVEVDVHNPNGRDRDIAEGYSDLGRPRFADAVDWAVRYADERGISTVVTVDRTAGRSERQVVGEGGRRDHVGAPEHYTGEEPEIRAEPSAEEVGEDRG
jgi:hypothetical protein